MGGAYYIEERPRHNLGGFGRSRDCSPKRGARPCPGCVTFWDFRRAQTSWGPFPSVLVPFRRQRVGNSRFASPIVSRQTPLFCMFFCDRDNRRQLVRRIGDPLETAVSAGRVHTNDLCGETCESRPAAVYFWHLPTLLGTRDTPPRTCRSAPQCTSPSTSTSFAFHHLARCLRFLRHTTTFHCCACLGLSDDDTAYRTNGRDATGLGHSAT